MKLHNESENSLVFSCDGKAREIDAFAPILLVDGKELIFEFGEYTADNASFTFKCNPIATENGEYHLTVKYTQETGTSLIRKNIEVVFIGEGTHLIEEIILDRLPFAKYGRPDFKEMMYSNHPAFFSDFFAAIEYPLAFTKVENNTHVLSHKPGKKLRAGDVYVSLTLLYGFSENPKSLFISYLEKYITKPDKFHVNYNSWWSIPNPYSEEDIYQLIDEFDKNLYKPYGVCFDSFCADLGWSNPKSIYDVNREKLSGGFEALGEKVKNINSQLGVWNSPSGLFGPISIDHEWAKKEGYEITFFENPMTKRKFPACCLAGEKYPEAYREALKSLVRKYDIAHIKFDSIAWECSETSHGHEPGEYVCEEITANMIRTFEEIRSLKKDVWLQPTCFGYFPSPWWVRYVSSVVGSFGDDAPQGRVPCPEYIESCTTSRDFFNLQAAGRLMIPIRNQEVMGFYLQSDYDFLNDLMVTILRGHALLSLYVNPRKLDQRGWKVFAEVIKWLRINDKGLMSCEPIIPESWAKNERPDITNDAQMVDEVYGYQHYSETRSLVLLRNPGLNKKKYLLTLPANSSKVDILSIYPEKRIYAKGIPSVTNQEIVLAPYETLILEIIPENTALLNDTVEISNGKIDFADTVLNCNKTEQDLNVEFNSQVSSVSDTNIHLLFEGPENPIVNNVEVTVDELIVPYSITGTGVSWSDSRLPLAVRWTYLNVKLPRNINKIRIKASTNSQIQRISACAISSKKGNYSIMNELPQPEKIYLDSVLLAEKTID